MNTAESDCHTPTVLLVEDDEATRLAMASWLAREGYLVLTAANGHEAIGHLTRPLAPIDVAVLDVDLPDVDGVALCARLRELYPTLPVLVCTGMATSDEAARLLDLGARRYFRKPVDPDELLSAVEAALP
jgi:DNA-binding response OmpR family regulator